MTEQPKTLADIAKLPTLHAQLEALNEAPVPTLSAEELHVVKAAAGAYEMGVAAAGAEPPRDVLRSLLGAAFQILRPLATEEQVALANVDRSRPT